MKLLEKSVYYVVFSWRYSLIKLNRINTNKIKIQMNSMQMNRVPGEFVIRRRMKKTQGKVRILFSSSSGEFCCLSLFTLMLMRWEVWCRISRVELLKEAFKKINTKKTSPSVEFQWRRWRIKKFLSLQVFFLYIFWLLLLKFVQSTLKKKGLNKYVI